MNLVKSRVRKEKFILQTIPKRLESLTNIKWILFKDKQIKSDYLIDIIHSLYIKYLFKEENLFSINSIILKKKYGHLYNYYIDFLVTNKILILVKNYLKGKNSRIYSFNQKLLKSDFILYKNTDKFLLKRNLLKSLELENKSPIESNIKDRLISDLWSVELDYQKSLQFVNLLEKSESQIKNLFSINAIKEKSLFYNFDQYGRFHTNFTILKSEIRKNYLYIDGEKTFEIDIPNSQPFFLTRLIQDSNYAIEENEWKLFCQLVNTGTYYQYLMDKLNISKSEAKKMTYKVLFGKNYFNSKVDKSFKSFFPSIYKFLKEFKKESGDYKILSHKLQLMESDLIFNKVIKTLYLLHPDIKLITIHDSIITSQKYKESVNNILRRFIYNE